jgi:hypothetical protein
MEAAAHDLGDFLRFASGKYTAAADPDRGGSQYFQVYLGPSRVDGVKVDIAVRRTLVGTPRPAPCFRPSICPGRSTGKRLIYAPWAG